MTVKRSPYHPPRSEAIGGRNGAVSTAHPYATMAALDVLRDGGSAVDAAIAAGAVLTVVMPWAGQLGGDCFMLIRESGGTVAAVNGSGAAPAAATVECYNGRIPEKGWLTSTVPGMLDGWARAHQEWGKLPWHRLFDAATGYAADGFPVGETFRERMIGFWDERHEYPETSRVFFPNGVPPPKGTILKQPDLAATLQALAAGGSDVFYTGDIAEAIASCSASGGGLMTQADLGSHSTPNTEPISISYGDATIFAQPPVSQGIVLLMALGALREARPELPDPLTADGVHRQVEAIKLGFRDRLTLLGDPGSVLVPVEEMLSEDAHRRRAGEIDPLLANDQLRSVSSHADTTSLVIADGDGRAVTYLHSLYTGSGVVVPGTGIMMNSRMLGFSLDPDSPNVLAPGKRPVHTLNAAVAVRGEMVFGVCTPGANLQVQHSLQVLIHVLDQDMELDEALDAPRWSLGDAASIGDLTLHVEDRFGEETLNELRRRGHQVEKSPSWSVGGMQAIRLNRESCWVASDPRQATSLAAAV